MRIGLIILLTSALSLTACNGCEGEDKPGDDTGIADATDAVDGEADSTDIDTDAGQDIALDSCDPMQSSDATTPSDFDINGWSLRIMANGAWTLTDPNDVEALSGPGICEQADDGALPFARVARGEPFMRSVFGAFQIKLHGTQSDLEWFAPRGLPRIEEVDGTVRMTWDLPREAGEDASASLTFAPEKDTHIAIALETSADDMNTGEFAMTCTEAQAFFGLGSQVTGLDLRPGNYPLWTQEQGNGKPEENNRFPINNIPEAAYAPMGVWHSSSGYSAIIGHDAYSELDLCETHEDRVWLRSHQAMPSFVLVAGETPRERLTEITEYTGRLDTDLPAWLFSAWVDAVDGAWRIEDVVTALRDNGISSSAVWTEDWIGSSPTTSGFRLTYEWTWDQTTYPDLDTRIDGLHGDGLAFLAYFNPFVPDTVSHYQEGVDNGYLITDEEGEIYTFKDPATRDASLIDLTNPDAVAWLQGFQKTAAEDLGIDGWMADFAEWLPVDAQLDSGVSGWQFHNRYPLAWQQANRGSLSDVHSGEDADNWSYFVRSGWASVNGGTAGIVPAMWGGDQDTDWAYDDGFPTIIPIGANLGMAGVAIYGSDIAGYNSIATTNTDKELFFRWSAAAAFHPLMRTHHGGDECDNWSFDQDAETIAHFRRYAAIHALLYPYFQSLLPDAKERGWPITRHPYLVEPDRAALWSDDNYEWFVGDDILVAPVLQKGATERTVTLPTGDWWPLLGDALVDSTSDVDGNAVEATVDAAVTETPAFVRPGTALPLLARAVDSFYGVNNPQLTDLSDVDGEARLALYPAEDGTVATPTDATLSATGTGWTGLASLDVSAASVGGQALEACDAAGNPVSCYDDGTGTIRVAVDGETTLSVGSAELVLDAEAPTTVTLGVAADAWGDWAEPTTYTGPNPDAPTWCDDAPAEE